MMMSRLTIAGIVSLTLLAGCMSPSGSTVQDKRQAARNMRSETLTKLYDIHPFARTQINKSVGYGVFSNVGVNLFLFSTASGWGIVRDNGSGRDTYMKMYSAGLGIGLGVKDFRGVFVFTKKHPQRFHQ